MNVYSQIKPASRWVLMLVFSVVSVSCGKEKTEGTVEGSPEAAIVDVVEGLQQNKPEVLWDSLPPRYQSDVKELLVEFTDHMDSKLYDRSFRILSKVVEVMDEKEAFIFNSPMALGTPIIESRIGNYWREIVELLGAVINSDVAKLDSLKSLDPGEFMASTGGRVMKDLKALVESAQTETKGNPWELLKQLEVRPLFEEGDAASIEVVSPGGKKETVEMARVDGVWVTSEMAANWDAGVAAVEAGLTKLSGPEFKKSVPIIYIVLGTAEELVDSLLEAESQKAFDASLKKVSGIGEMIKGFGNQ